MVRGLGGHTVYIASLLCRLDARCWRSSGSLVTTRACRRSAVTTTSASMTSEVPARPQTAPAALPRSSVSGVTWQPPEQPGEVRVWRVAPRLGQDHDRDDRAYSAGEALLVQCPQAAVMSFAANSAPVS